MSKEIIETLVIPPLVEIGRASDVLHKYLTSVGTKSMTKKLIKKGVLLINGRRANSGDYIKGGERITYLDKNTRKKQIQLSIPVLYEDEDLAIVHKPAGLLTNGNQLRQLENALPYNLNLKNSYHTPRPVHRLDQATAGLVLVAKTLESHRLLTELFKSKSILKTYEAIVIGSYTGPRLLTQSIDSKEALTAVTVINTYPSKRFTHIAHLSLRPLTGRTHQLRIHLSQAGNPIMGDRLYCTDDDLVKGKGLFLHAKALSFVHPITNKPIEVIADSLPKFRKVLSIAPPIV